jgi:phosphohistidine phosphatase
MKTLSLLRHAHAEKHSDDGSDFTRRLDARGLEEAVEIADWAKRLGLGPERLIASPALRTRMTARAVTEALALADSQVNFDHRVYEASRPTLTDLLTELPAHLQHVLLVGHNPGLTKLVRWLTDDDSVGELTPATFVSLSMDIDDWTFVGRGLASVVRRLTPTHR